MAQKISIKIPSEWNNNFVITLNENGISWDSRMEVYGKYLFHKNPIKFHLWQTMESNLCSYCEHELHCVTFLTDFSSKDSLGDEIEIMRRVETIFKVIQASVEYWKPWEKKSLLFDLDAAQMIQELRTEQPFSGLIRYGLQYMINDDKLST